jgi:HEAT repeats
MLIVLDCPSCAKRYEVDVALAGKRSRCKQCGEVFKIPVPNAKVASPPPSTVATRPERPSTDTGERARSVPANRSADPRGVGTATSPSYDPSPAATTKIVMNCPGCRKRYEVDEALAGKKSRCKDCGEVFLIPVPRGRQSDPVPAERPVSAPLLSPTPPPRAPASTPPPPTYWESVDEEGPTVFKPRRNPAFPAYDEVDLPPPPRAIYAKPTTTSRRPRDWGNNPDVGITVAGLYVAAAILVVIGFWTWIQAASPPADRIGQIFAITSFLLHGTALLLSLGGNIWLLVIAFKEKMEQGLLCLLVPCYAFYYIFSRWEDTKGAFVLELLPVGNIILLFGIAYAVGMASGRNAADAARERLAARSGAVAAEDSPPPPVFAPRVGIPPTGGRQRNPRFDSQAKVRSFVNEHGDRAVILTFSGIPTNSEPANGVTTRDVSEAVRARARELAPGATNFMWVRRNNRSVLALSPVDDIPGLAQRIDFGKATVRGDQIDVVLSPEYVASVPRLAPEAPVTAANPGRTGRSAEPEIPPGADEVTRSLAQLKSPDVHTRKQGAERLGRIAPDDRLAEVVAALVTQLEHDDQWLVSDAIKALAVWKSAEAVPSLIVRTSDNRFLVRHEAIKALAKIKDPRAVEPILARIKEDGFQVEDALKEIGAVAEPALIERLRYPDSGIRRRACVILKEIGGREALKAMQSLPPDADLGVRVAAQDAMRNIAARVGPLPASERKGKATGSTSRGRGPG